MFNQGVAAHRKPKQTQLSISSLSQPVGFSERKGAASCPGGRWGAEPCGRGLTTRGWVQAWADLVPRRFQQEPWASLNRKRPRRTCPFVWQRWLWPLRCCYPPEQPRHEGAVRSPLLAELRRSIRPLQPPL